MYMHIAVKNTYLLSAVVSNVNKIYTSCMVNVKQGRQMYWAVDSPFAQM